MPSPHLGQKPEKKAKHSGQQKSVEETEDVADAATVPGKLKSLTESLQSMLNSGQKSKSRSRHVSPKESADDDQKVKRVMEMVEGVTSMVGVAGADEEERPVKRSKKKKGKRRPR